MGRWGDGRWEMGDGRWEIRDWEIGNWDYAPDARFARPALRGRGCGFGRWDLGFIFNLPIRRYFVPVIYASLRATSNKFPSPGMQPPTAYNTPSMYASCKPCRDVSMGGSRSHSPLLRS